MGWGESDEEERLAMLAAELRDWRGELIVVGTRIVYPGRRGSLVWMNEAEVVEIFQKEATWPRDGLHPALKVKRLRMASYGAALTVEQKLVTLTELGRVTVVY